MGEGPRWHSGSSALQSEVHPGRNDLIGENVLKWNEVLKFELLSCEDVKTTGGNGRLS